MIAAIVWIGTSFYFVALDNHLRPPERGADAEDGVAGESWEIHGGGFYRIQKFRVAPPTLPEPLHWFKWEAYTTWLSGFALLVVLYYVNARTYLIDPSVADLDAVGGDPDLDRRCSSSPGSSTTSSAALLDEPSSSSPLAVARPRRRVAAWGCSELFAPRAAYLQVGAMLGTIMVANVFFVIIPAHWELRAREGGGPRARPGAGAPRQAALGAQQLPDAAGALRDARRALPVHVRTQRTAWLVLVVLMVIGAWIRLFFNLRHAGENVWSIPVTAALAIAAVAIAIRPQGGAGGTPASPAGGQAVPFVRAQAIVQERCVALPLVEPDAGWTRAPLGITFDTPAQIRRAERPDRARGRRARRSCRSGTRPG